MNATITKPIVLTAPPAVVDLKRKFRVLDEQEEKLKGMRCQDGDHAADVYEQLEAVRKEKQQIAAQVFNLCH